jgi:hypothetical protein
VPRRRPGCHRRPPGVCQGWQTTARASGSRCWASRC